MKNFKLDKIEKIKSGFETPEGYFDTFPTMLIDEVLLKESKTISLWDRNKQWIYGTAAVIVLSVSLPVMHNIKPTQKEISSNEIENYLTYHSTLTEDDLVDLLNVEDIEKIKIDKPININETDEILLENTEISD